MILEEWQTVAIDLLHKTHIENKTSRRTMCGKRLPGELTRSDIDADESVYMWEVETVKKRTFYCLTCIREAQRRMSSLDYIMIAL